MKRFLICILALLMLLPGLSAAAEKYYGTVVCGAAVPVTAPFGGTVSGLNLRAGDLVRAGEAVCTLETRPVCSPVKGTVSAVFGEPGDSTEDLKERRGGVVYLIPEHRYTVYAGSRDAGKSPENYLYAGQKVFLSQSKSRTPAAGEGTVLRVVTETAEEGSVGEFTVEITDGEFSPGDIVSLYRTEARDKDAYLGSGTVQQSPPVIVSGEGSILRMHVRSGDTVERGTLLYETVSGPLAGLKGRDNTVRADTDGIVASVETTGGAAAEPGAALITLYPLSGLRVCITAAETELDRFYPGRKVRLTFGADTMREGTVETASYLAETAESGTSAAGYASYRVYIDFDEKTGVRQGLLVTAELTD